MENFQIHSWMLQKNTLFIVFIIYAVHIYDRILVKRINEHEEQLEKKGILKRHFTKKIDDK